MYVLVPKLSYNPHPNPIPSIMRGIYVQCISFSNKTTIFKTEKSMKIHLKLWRRWSKISSDCYCKWLKKNRHLLWIYQTALQKNYITVPLNNFYRLHRRTFVELPILYRSIVRCLPQRLEMGWWPDSGPRVLDELSGDWRFRQLSGLGWHVRSVWRSVFHDYVFHLWSSCNHIITSNVTSANDAKYSIHHK